MTHKLSKRWADLCVLTARLGFFMADCERGKEFITITISGGGHVNKFKALSTKKRGSVAIWPFWNMSASNTTV
jgi:hypothetical protein